MNPLVQDMLMSLLRKGLVAAGTYLVTHGIFTQNEWANYSVGLATLLLGAGWSLWNKYLAQKLGV